MKSASIGILLSILAATPPELSASTQSVQSPEINASGEVNGEAFFEKIPLTSEGLGLDQVLRVPIREAAVEVLSKETGQIVSTGQTDMGGRFRIEIPAGEGYFIRVLSRSPSSGVVVADNTNAGRIYSIGVDAFPGQQIFLLARDEQRTSGAFNLLEVLRRANEFLRATVPGILLPELRVFWSWRNTTVRGDVPAGEIGGTFFDSRFGTAYVLGDREQDSDEFDDSVILHEYGHLLAARFSRDDSLGGPHLPGDVLDPRVAWSEGWANFFASVVQGSPIYRDSLGPDGTAVLEYDLETNALGPAGYWNEATVHSLLWDLIDGGNDLDDGAQIELSAMWQAFSSLTGDSFVYLKTFLDRLSELLTEQTPLIEQTARQHFLSFVESDQVGPFPKLVAGSRGVTGEVDSWSSGRFNLAQSAHLYGLEITGGAVSAELEITGLGPAGNPNANDLDLILMNAEGRILAEASQGTNGEGERLSTFLPAGIYVLEVRSYRSDHDTGELLLNSGAYQLRVSAP